MAEWWIDSSHYPGPKDEQLDFSGIVSAFKAVGVAAATTIALVSETVERAVGDIGIVFQSVVDEIGPLVDSPDDLASDHLPPAKIHRHKGKGVARNYGPKVNNAFDRRGRKRY